ncbi:MAG: hypothetical protein QXT45_00425 [Candidatus Bilamarchaeaceae archaeon]
MVRLSGVIRFLLNVEKRPNVVFPVFTASAAIPNAEAPSALAANSNGIAKGAQNQ